VQRCVKAGDGRIIVPMEHRDEDGLGDPGSQDAAIQIDERKPVPQNE